MGSFPGFSQFDATRAEQESSFCAIALMVPPSLLLASNSPRRRELLLDAGFDFQIFAPCVEERLDFDLTLRELTALNAIRKGISTARLRPKHVVLAADTLVTIDDHVLGKPRDLKEAVAMLKQLSGRAHEVYTSVFICDLDRARSTSFYEISRVYFHRLTDAEIGRYIGTVNSFDKAGAYAAQGAGAAIIKKIEGSYSNVIGLPMERTKLALLEFGILPKQT